MNFSVKSACLVLTLCASTMAHPWSFPFGSSSGSSTSSSSWSTWTFSKPAWFSGLHESAATKCDSISTSVVSGLNAADKKLDKVSQALDPQAAPSWNPYQIVQVGLIGWTTAHIFYRGWALSEKKKQNTIITQKKITMDSLNVVIGQQKNSIAALKAEQENQTFCACLGAKTKAYSKGFYEGKQSNETEVVNLKQQFEKARADKEALEFQQRLMMGNNYKPELYQDLQQLNATVYNQEQEIDGWRTELERVKETNTQANDRIEKKIL